MKKVGLRIDVAFRERVTTLTVEAAGASTMCAPVFRKGGARQHGTSFMRLVKPAFLPKCCARAQHVYGWIFCWPVPHMARQAHRRG